MVEGGPELVQLLLADALGVSCQDLVLNFVDGASDGGEELLPAHADVLGRRRFSVIMTTYFHTKGKKKNELEEHGAPWWPVVDN